MAETRSREYVCPLFRSCNCSVIWKLVANEESKVFWLLCNGKHVGISHSNYRGKFLGPFQKAAVVRAVQNDPNYTGTMVIRIMTNVEDERVQIDHSLKGLVDRLVRCEWDAVFSKVLGGVKVSGNVHDEVVQEFARKPKSATAMGHVFCRWHSPCRRTH